MKKINKCHFFKQVPLFLTMALLTNLVTTVEAQKLPFIMDMVHNNPGEKPFVTKYNNPAFLQQQQFNGKVVQWLMNTAINYNSFEKDIVPVGSKERIWIENKAKEIDVQLQACESAGLPVYAFTDFLVFPQSIWEKYGASIQQTVVEGDAAHAEAKKYRKPDIQKPVTQQLLIAQINELFLRFPALDGLVLRFGETYLHDAPFHSGNSPISNDYQQSIKDHITLINILREEVCIKRNKVLFYRTWDFGDRFHNNGKYYLQVTDAIAPHPNLFFSIKYQQGDFHRMHPFNPALGTGKHKQIVESQSQMEAYGKAAHPYYTGKGVIDGWPETKYEIDHHNSAFTGRLNKPGNPRGLKDILSKKLLSGVMTWSHGGGWQGPYVENEIWIDLNTYVVAQWALNTRKSEEAIFQSFCDSLKMSAQDADIFRKIALTSIEAVRKGQLCSYTENNVWWTRDEYFSCGTNNKIVKKIVESGNDLAQKVLAEKAESVAMWLQIENMAKQLQLKDSSLLTAIQVSCTYGRIKFQLIEQMWILMLENGKQGLQQPINKTAIQAAINTYETLWAEWKELKKQQPLCASLYSDLAFRNDKRNSARELVAQMKALLK